MPRLLPLVLAAGFVSLGCFQAAPEPAAEEKPVEVAPEVPRDDPPLIVTAVEKTDEVAVAPMPREARERDLTNEDIGLDPKIETALPEIERLDKLPVVEVPGATDPLGLPDL